jgi:AmiR/NasT family two-component response regulator
MLERAVPFRRVLIGEFGVVARMGLRELLAEEGLEVLGAVGTRREIIPRLSEVQPDVVLLDLDTKDAPELAARISAAFPAMKVIACSSDEPIMRVFPPFHYGESYIAPFTRVLFAAALKD